MVSVTSARPNAGRPAVPAKMTSSILPPRRLLAPCSPSTQAMASTTLDLPDPFGPTTAVMPGSRRRVVADAKDLKPLSVRLDRCTGSGSQPGGRLRRGPEGTCGGGGAGGTDESGPRAASGQRGLGGAAGQGEQFVGDRGIALGTQRSEFLLQTAHLGPQGGVLLRYSELSGCDDVTEQGLGHGCGGLSNGVRCSDAPYDGRRGCGTSRVTGQDTQVNAQTAYPPCRDDVTFVTSP